MEKNALWSGLLRYMYKNLKVKVFLCDKSVLSKEGSIWWKDIILVDFNSETNNSFFLDLINCRLRDGRKIPFWHCKWIGNQAMQDAFLEVYAATSYPLIRVAEAGV